MGLACWNLCADLAKGLESLEYWATWWPRHIITRGLQCLATSTLSGISSCTSYPLLVMSLTPLVVQVSQLPTNVVDRCVIISAANESRKWQK